MTFEFRPAVREGIPLLLGLAGPSGGGKTFSAMRLAKGLAGDKRFAVIDTEAGRALHYADDFEFDHCALDPPFTPQRYMDAIRVADEAGYPVIVVDSASHEHAGDGGLLDMHEDELQRMAGDDARRRDAMTMAAWIKPKKFHKSYVSRLLQVRAHVVLCLRAESKIEIAKEGGKTVIRPKRSLVGHDGWIPIAEKTLPFELSLSVLVTPDAPGVPKPIKLAQAHRLLVPLDKPLSEETGEALAGWAQGVKDETEKRVLDLATQLLEYADELGNRDVVTAAIQKNRSGNDLASHAKWLQKQVETARAAAEKLREDQPDLEWASA